jgi:hypothetical protein
VTRPRRQTRTARAQAAFLAEFALCGNVLRSALKVRVGRQTVYHWLKDPAFQEIFDAAHQDALDRLEEEARRRAVDGVLEPVVSGGQLVTYRTRYSDALLALLLKAKRPDIYRERRDSTVKDDAVRTLEPEKPRQDD